ncbi:MAG: hypothetical protein U5K30_04550 [Acidimicrobiales bacterium]|nr:hypothetical protein [Acidimicrobiales bacterium]
MSPVERRRGGAHTGRAVAVAIVGVTIAFGAAFLVANLASSGDVDVHLGDDRFDAGEVENRAESVDEGGPVLFPDPANFTRAIYIDHRSNDPTSGWIALGAFEPDDPDCSITFDTERELYVSACDESVTFPRSGAGLRQYPTEVSDGRLFIDLQDEDDSTPE